MKIFVGSKNAGKIEGARRAFARYFENIDVVGVSVSSDVPDQPVNDDIYNGAVNRVINLKKYAVDNNIAADYYVSIESGINNLLGDWIITNVAVIENSDGERSMATSPSFPVPNRLVDEIISTDLNKVMNKVFSEDKDRHNGGGAIELLTHGELSRIDLTEVAFIMALTKFINKDKWK